jgi:photosystem II stability/assembly factor-like uncharacterized protein
LYKILSSALIISFATSCGRVNGNVSPQMPIREFSSPTYNLPTNDFTANLPEGTKPVEMKISGLTEKEKESNIVTLPVGQVKQFFVDIKLDNNKVLKNYNAVTWSVSNTEIASINLRGVLTPLREGQTKVIATIGGVSTSIVVNISAAMNIWSQVISTTNKDLYSVKMVNDMEAWAVGQGGTILHYLNGNWIDESRSANVIEDLLSVDVTPDGQAWAVGGSTILRYNNGSWERFPLTIGGELRAIDMVSANDGWIVGSKGNGDALVLRYTGGSWQPVETKIDRELNTVCALGPNEVWVGGKSRVLGPPAMFKFDGSKWNRARFNNTTLFSSVLDNVKPWDGTYEVKAIKMLNSSQGWAVGEYTPVLSTLRGKRGFMFFFDQVKDVWIRGTFDKSTPNLDQVPLKNVGMISAGKGWVLGSNVLPNQVIGNAVNEIPGVFLSSDGKNLKVDTQYQANTVGKTFYGIDILPNGNGIVVGEKGFIMHHQYDMSRPNYFNNSGRVSGYSNYGTPSYYNENRSYNNY